ncbi:MAG: hypothetical protein ABI627_22875 [Polyangiaceae bacterium]
MGKCDALVLFMGLVVGCGRVASPEAEPGAAGSAGSAGSADSAGSAGSAGSAAAAGRPDGDSSAGRAGASTTTSGGAGAGGFGGEADAGAAGAAGDQSATALPLPADCEAQGQSATDSTCSLSVTCHGEPNSINCHRVDSGDWECSCDPMHSERTLSIGGAVGLPACAVAAGLCSVNELALGEQVCSEVRDFPSDDSCGLDLACRTPIVSEQLPGVQAELLQSGRATCAQLAGPTVLSGQAPYGCSCWDSPRQDLTVLDTDATHACRSVLDFCLSGKQPSFGTTSTCTANSRTRGAGYCESLQLCGPQMPLNETASLVHPALQRTVSCIPLESGTLECDCDMENIQVPSVGSGYSFRVADVTLNTCDPSLCRPGVAPEPTGPVGDCEPGEDLGVGLDACAVTFGCLIPASIEGHDVTLEAPLSVSCAKRAIDNTWWCACGSGATTTKFELGAAADREEACGLAPPHCLAQMSLQLGPAQWGGVPLPDPLP